MATLPPVRIGVLGLGTVGCGTLNVLKRNGSEIARRAGRSIEVVRASARDLTKSRAADTGGIDLSDDPFALVEDPSIEIIVELIGGTDPARELVLRALDNGKHVVTANKALIALHGNEVFARAQSKGLMVAFEAAVAGGIPVIKAVREALAGNAIEWLAGIVNDVPCRDTAAVRAMEIPYYARSVTCVPGTTQQLFETQIPNSLRGYRGPARATPLWRRRRLNRRTGSGLCGVDPGSGGNSAQGGALGGMAEGRSLLEMLNFSEHCARIRAGEESALEFRA